MQNALKLQLLDTDCMNNSRLKSELVHTHTHTHNTFLNNEYKLLRYRATVSVQLPTSADIVALPAFAAVRRDVAWLLLTAGRAATD